MHHRLAEDEDSLCDIMKALRPDEYIVFTPISNK